ncbi:Importin-13 [Sergentomyia squamirostris]
MEIDIKVLEEAVVLFYRSETKQQAHQWLQAVQVSPQAWQFCWELMHPDKSCEVQFFGATTLHSKLLKYWHEVPKENHQELKEKILEAIVAFGGGPKLVLNRLCIAFSAFIVHMLDQWPTAIEDVTNTFQNQQLPNLSVNTQVWIMMEILGGIPEEANAIYTSVQRAMLRQEITKRTGFILSTIDNYLCVKCDSPMLEEAETASMLRAVKCGGLWLKNGHPMDSCLKFAETLLKLVNKCYWSCVQGDGCMTADENELAEVCLETLSFIMIQPDAHRFPNTALVMIRMFLDSLTEIIKAEWRENNLNEDIAVGIYTLLIASIESQSRLLLSGIATDNSQHRELYTRLIEEILQCTNKPGIYPVEESCSILAMGFWYMLQDEVLSIDSDQERNKCLEMIRPLYAHLSKVLVRKAQQPNEVSIERWSADDLETFRCYRQDISDTLMYCYDVLHENLLEIFAVLLDEGIIAVQRDQMNWPQLESVIYSMCSIAEHINVTENKVIPKLMHTLSEIPYENLNEKLLGTGLETIGSYCEWFKENPTYLPPAIDLLVKGLNSPMASQATLGLKELTRECQMQMKVYAEPLLKACEQSLHGGHLKNAESVRLMYSIGRLMSMLTSDKIPSCLDSMVSPCFEELQLITQNRTQNEAAKIRTLFRLNMVSTLYSSLNTRSVQQENTDTTNSQPVLLVMEKTMPIFRQIGEMWIDDTQIIEALCNSLKYAVTNLMNDSKPMLPDLCCLIVSIFQTKCVCPAMDIAKTCIIMFYNDGDLHSKMHQLLVEIIMYNIRHFEQIPETNFSDAADLLESFYGLNSQIVRKLPAAYSRGDVDCVKLIHFALKAIVLPESGPVKYGTQFLSHFIMQSRQFPNMNTTVIERGGQIIQTTLMCIGSLTPRTQVEVFADIFLSINKKYPQELIVWMKILATPQFPTTCVSDSEKNAFMNTIIREKVNKRIIQGQVREFSAKCRGLVEKI